MSSNKGKKLHNYPKTRKPQRERSGNRYLRVGERFGRWLLLEDRGRNHTGKRIWLCRCDCGTEKVVLDATLKNGSSVSCGCYKNEMLQVMGSLKREKSPAWKGGRHIDTQGYAHVYAPDHHSVAGKKNPKLYIREHILVMEKHLGRAMLPGETVHHRNGQRADNRIENLELWAFSHRAGQRVVDLLAWAKEIITRYDGVVIP